MDKCLQHTKESVGPCMWCGKKLCEKCVTHQEGKKLYCDKCAEQLNPMTRMKMPMAKAQIASNKQGETQWI